MIKPEGKSDTKELFLMLSRLLPKQADEILRAISAKIPIMLIDNIGDDTEMILHRELRKAGAIVVPPCIKDYRKENISHLCIYLNVKS